MHHIVNPNLRYLMDNPPPNGENTLKWHWRESYDDENPPLDDEWKIRWCRRGQVPQVMGLLLARLLQGSFRPARQAGNQEQGNRITRDETEAVAPRVHRFQNRNSWHLHPD